MFGTECRLGFNKGVWQSVKLGFNKRSLAQSVS